VYRVVTCSEDDEGKMVVLDVDADHVYTEDGVLVFRRSVKRSNNDASEDYFSSKDEDRGWHWHTIVVRVFNRGEWLSAERIDN
jgi:hypothetical protein